MATTTTGTHRNGNYSRNSLTTNNNKVEKPVSVNSNPKSSLKFKSLPGSGLRKSAPASLGAAKDDTGG